MKKITKAPAPRGRRRGRPRKYEGAVVTPSLSIPAVLWDQVKQLAEADGVSASEWVVGRLTRSVRRSAR